MNVSIVQSPAIPSHLNADPPVAGSFDVSDDHWSKMLADSYALIERIVRTVARRHRLSREEADELASLVRYRLVDGRYRILRRFEGRSSLKTYLTTAITRIWLDVVIREHGKWRPSAAARNGGQTAIALERLLVRDRLSLDQALEALPAHTRQLHTRAEIDQLRSRLPSRMRPQLCSIDEAERVASATDPFPEDNDAQRSMEQRRAVSRALLALPLADRQLLTLRFRDGWPVKKIAQAIHVDQKAAYRRFANIYKAVRVAVEQPSDVRRETAG